MQRQHPLVRRPGRRHNAGVFVPQLQAVPQEPAAQSAELLQQLQLLGWVDRTALCLLLVFFAMGLFKGLIWQVSRVAILVVAYVVAGRFGQPLGDLLARTEPNPAAPDQAPIDTPETTLYLAYVLVFLVVLVALSLLSIALQKLAAKAGLGFFDRLGGGVLGVATGGCVVLFLLFVVQMFFQGSQLAMAAESSHAQRLSRRTIDALGEAVPDALRGVFSLAPLHPTPPATPGPGPAPGPGAEPSDAPGEPPAGPLAPLPGTGVPPARQDPPPVRRQ
jgi:uncharacterized membrane protein required for colicin V production